MNPRPVPVLRGYLAALRRHVRTSSPPVPGVARALGTRAVKNGLEILDLAKIHEDSLIALGFPLSAGKSNDEMIRRAGTFFAEALTPIEETHRGMVEANILLKAAVKTLEQRTTELDDANRELNREIDHRKEIEDSLRTSESTSSQLLAKSVLMQEELRLLSRRLLSIQEEERKRISRELHDVISQTLVGINVRLATLRLQSTANAKELQRKIAITQRLVEKSMGIVHRFAIDLRPSVLDDLGLIPALRSHLKRFTASTGIKATFTAEPPLMKLSGASRTVLYRIAQEALTNVSRHSKASHVTVVVEKLKDVLRMEITDNGIGFKISDLELPHSTERLGLLGMRERVDMIGGTFRVESVPGKETTLTVELPLGKRPLKKNPAGRRAATPSKRP
jgi:signal transduction histidine kinase